MTQDSTDDMADAALASDPDNRALLAAKIDALLADHQYAEALPLCLRLVTLLPAEPSHWTFLCRALRDIGFVDLALRVHAHAVGHVTPDFDLLRFRGDTLYEGRHFARAIAAYQPVLEEYGEDAQAWQIWYNYSGCLSALARAKDAAEADWHALRALRRVLDTGHVTAHK